MTITKEKEFDFDAWEAEMSEQEKEQIFNRILKKNTQCYYLWRNG